jgi:hypothetical protein
MQQFAHGCKFDVCGYDVPPLSGGIMNGVPMYGHHMVQLCTQVLSGGCGNHHVEGKALLKRLT